MLGMNRRQATAVMAALLSAPMGAAAAAPPAPRPLELWPEGAPGAGGASVEDRPAVTAYLPSPEGSTGAGVLVFPGGGFTRRCEDHEGVLVAEWLRAHGVAAFIVRYRVVPIGTVKDALDDGHRAIQYVRAHAQEWSVSPQRLGAIGFSAGAVLAANVSLRPRPGQAASTDPLQRVTSRPDFLVLAYGDANQANPGTCACSNSNNYSQRRVHQLQQNWRWLRPTYLRCRYPHGGRRHHQRQQ